MTLPAATLRLEDRHTGEVLDLRRYREDGVPLLEIRGSLPAHSMGPPLHIHFLEDEEGLVKAGTLSAVVGERRVDAGPGQSVHLPRGIPHRWWNEGDTELVFVGRARPVEDLDRYLQAVFEVMNASPLSRRWSKRAIARRAGD